MTVAEDGVVDLEACVVVDEVLEVLVVDVSQNSLQIGECKQTTINGSSNNGNRNKRLLLKANKILFILR